MFFVRDLLDFSSISLNKMNKDISLFDIKQAISEIVDIQSYQAKRTGTIIKVEYKGDLLKKCDYQIRTDQQRLQQVLLNLLSNAFKYTQKGEVKIFVCIVENSNKDKFIKVAV